MLCVIVPAHNEEASISACVRSLRLAACHIGLNHEPVKIIVVLDACGDRTGLRARQEGASILEIEARNVGSARELGARAALAAGARWLSFTDADTTVAPDWLVAQLALRADAVCGTVTVEDWGEYGNRMHRHFEATYSDRDEHRHVHGANLGVSAQSFKASGGFQALRSGEDVALVEALKRCGASIAWSNAPRVVTSARANFRAPDGFGATLAHIAKHGLWEGVTSSPSLVQM